MNRHEQKTNVYEYSIMISMFRYFTYIHSYIYYKYIHIICIIHS